MKGPKPKAPKEARADVEEEIRALMDGIPPQRIMTFLFTFFTTIDLVGIRDRAKEIKDAL